MPAAIAPVPSDTPVGQQKKGTAEQSAPIPFARSSKWHAEQGNVTSGIVVNTAVPGTFNFTLPSYGYLSAVYVTAIATGGSGTAAVYYEDAPWSIFQNILLTDVNGVPIWGPLSGYHTFLASKYGGYRLFGPDGSTTAFGPSTPTAIGNNPVNFTTNTGNFGFTLPIFFEFGRDGLGGLCAEYKPAVSVKPRTGNTEGTAQTSADAVETTRGYATKLVA